MRLRALALALAAALPMAAAEATVGRAQQSEERRIEAALDEAVGAFEAAYRALDGEAIMAVIPAEVLERLAETDEVEPWVWRTWMEGELDKLGRSAEMTRFEVRRDGAALDVADGGRVMLLPTSSEMALALGPAMSMETVTLAAWRDGRWSFFLLEDARDKRHVEALYPEIGMAGQVVPAPIMGRMEP